MQGIDAAIEAEVQAKLGALASQHQVTIISAIESGSRSWGFPSPDSDYDVRFVYAHASEWYIQLNPERDVIELPVNAVLDIGGWDVRKAMALANSGNSVIQEWMISPLVYREDAAQAAMLREMVASTFNARASFHHYSSMAKSMVAALDAPDIKLKRFFYISRATLSALWIAREHSMPTTVFPDLLQALTDDAAVLEAFQRQIRDKATKTEAETGVVDPLCLAFVREAYREVMATDIERLAPRREALGNEDLRAFLSVCQAVMPIPRLGSLVASSFAENSEAANGL
ncbi:MAG: nucleotidyltransferase domain-containing protein [Candidatus Thiothrix singaporensis]|uniref:Nucleotidyltransferase domain-containing protein n=1 Tax=Candidatus Thiothrix singaporensis TaxID=2799669 RepID=A0A7L6AW34_9GAMM|nr:MAG: nucleotidyltransferase domain-containing protein [Candidatus Thiothrix singaporensis]